MKHQIRKLANTLCDDFSNFPLGQAIRILIRRLKAAYSEFIKSVDSTDRITHVKFQRLGSRARSLRTELVTELSWSILMSVKHPNIKTLTIAMKSCFDQLLPSDEFLIGISPAEELLCRDLLTDFKKQAAKRSLQFKVIIIESEADFTNQLAEVAKNRFLLLVDQNAWIRPDLLYRYHQYLLSKRSLDLILYCDETQMDGAGNLLSDFNLEKPECFPYPFLFSNLIGACLSIPKPGWTSVGGLRSQFEIYSQFDLCLRLEHAGFILSGIPLCMYAREYGPQIETSPALGIQVLNEYFSCKGYSTLFSTGMTRSSFRPILERNSNVGVVIVVPFHNEIAMTLRCLKRLHELKSEQKTHIILVNNRSAPDHDLAPLRALADQWVEADFAFNYSKINNLAVKNCSVPSSEFPNVLFLNNDVILETGSLSEMVSWLSFEKVGIVGARLFYPNGLIQHGGIVYCRDSSLEENRWLHIDLKKSRADARFSSTILVSDAVTAACAMMRRTDFERIEGFDEVQYPIAYSDTDLCSRIRKNLSKVCLMTPYAEGIHHESLSRGKNDVEDYESSGWLTQHLGLALPSVTLRYP